MLLRSLLIQKAGLGRLSDAVCLRVLSLHCRGIRCVFDQLLGSIACLLSGMPRASDESGSQGLEPCCRAVTARLLLLPHVMWDDWPVF